jgi:hypothetical protein
LGLKFNRKTKRNKKVEQGAESTDEHDDEITSTSNNDGRVSGGEEGTPAVRYDLMDDEAKKKHATDFEVVPTSFNL